MDLSKLQKHSVNLWSIPTQRAMRVPGYLFADEGLLQAMDDQVYEQTVNVACLPGIVEAAYVMPDAHWGYGFPIGGVAAFDPQEGGIISAGGVGFDISCGVRCLVSGLTRGSIVAKQRTLADALFRRIPAGVGSTSALHMVPTEMDAMLLGGAQWAVSQGWGTRDDLNRIEDHGCMPGAEPATVSTQARHRQRNEMGTLGSGNHYLEVQAVAAIFDGDAAAAYDLRLGEIVITLHCGSRGLGHQIGAEFLQRMASSATELSLTLPDRELACAPINSALGTEYFGAMNAAINCALANRQILTQGVREVFSDFFPETSLTVLYDVSHNTCKRETHLVNGQPRELFIHRKGATRAWGPGHPGLPESIRRIGQPVLIGGSMGTGSWVMAGSDQPHSLAWSSACHGAGRAMSRRQALRRWQGRAVLTQRFLHRLGC